MKSLKIIEQITIRNEDSLNKYLNDISKISLISLEREVELAIQIKAGNKLALDTLNNSLLLFTIAVDNFNDLFEDKFISPRFRTSSSNIYGSFI